MQPHALSRQCVALLVGWVLAQSFASPATAADPVAVPAKPRPNVLFVAVDDLRPAVGAFGDKLAKTPHLDKLAARGLLLTRAYCQQAVCSPSRTSLLTGRRPDTTKVYDLKTHFRANLPDVVTLPQSFKAQGYHTAAMGKIYHDGLDDGPSWSEPTWQAGVPDLSADARAKLAAQREAFKAAGKEPGKARGVPYESPDVADDQLPDGAIAAHAVEALRARKADPGTPFFVAVGFRRPHLPFVAPKRYFDLHDLAAFKIPPNRQLPAGGPKFAGANSGELRNYLDIPAQGPVPDEQALRLIRAYYAATSYMDAQLGRVLDELERLDLAKNTVVVVWGDHGWSLGEHGEWCKHTNYEDTTRAPLMFAGPGVPVGKASAGLAEFVDVYPTLADLCGLPKPDGLEGASLAPRMADPAKPGKRAAFSQYPRNVPGKGAGMGYAVRTDAYRLVEWRVKGEVVARELYDEQADPAETRNLADQPEQAATVRKLSEVLRAGWLTAER